jgi:hypothetical protein
VLWSQERAGFTGRFVSFTDVFCRPQPPAGLALDRLSCSRFLGNQVVELAEVAVAESPSLRSLRMLSFTGSAIGDEGVEALAGSANLEHLEELFLSRCAIGDEASRPSPPRLG